MFSRRTGDIRPGLARVQKAWNTLGRPSSTIPSLLVGGTNGKGSVCGYSYHLLALLGLRVGLYTSPHLCHFRERIQLSYRTILDSDILSALELLKSRLDEATYESLSFFEIATLLGFMTFEVNRSEVNVIEVGMGGRWDATNLIDAEMACIVSIGMDHMAYLGDSIEAIAREKAPIARPGRRLFWGGQSPQAEAILRETGAIVAGDCLFQSGFVYFTGGDGQRQKWPIPDYFKDRAPFQRRNFALAAAMVHNLFFTRDGTFRALGTIGSRSAFEKRWEGAWSSFGSNAAPMGPSVLGRFQHLEIKLPVSCRGTTGKQDLLLDVCHNIDGVLAFGEALGSAGIVGNARSEKCPGLVSILGDKDVNGILDLLQGFLGPIVLFRIPNDRSFKEIGLAERFRDLPFFESFEDAFDFALTQWRGRGIDVRSEAPEVVPEKTWVICGSLAAVGEVLSVFQAAPENFLPSQKLYGVWQGKAPA